MFKLLRTNKHFHEGKKDAEEPEAEEYIENICRMTNQEANDTTYNELIDAIKHRHENGIDALTLTIRNEDMARIIQWQSHETLESLPKGTKCSICNKPTLNI